LDNSLEKSGAQTAHVKTKVPNFMLRVNPTTKAKQRRHVLLALLFFSSFMPRRSEQPLQPKMLGVPDFRDDIAKWNAGWEALFPMLNSIVGNAGFLVASRATLPSSEFQEELRSIHRIVRGICRTQEDLRMLAVTSVLQPNFCWKTLSPAAREAHMLEGLLRACLNEPDSAPHARLYTCDITLASLESGNGEGFLALLRRYVPEGEASITEGRCISYLHPGWSEEARKEAEVQLGIATRDKFLSELSDWAY
jgi:hypothetical protein